MPTQSIIAEDYARWLGEMKSRIRSAQLSAARVVNREMILLYWDIGDAIVEKQKALGWGEGVISRLSKDLRTAFPLITGFSARNLRDMKRLYLAYCDPKIWRQAVAIFPALEISGGKRRHTVAKMKEDSIPEKLRQLVAEIPWGHNLVILNKTTDPAPRLYYLQATAQFGWTRKVLLNQIKAGAYERSRVEEKTHNFPATLPEQLAEQADETLKSTYNLEFLGIHRQVKERELGACRRIRSGFELPFFRLAASGCIDDRTNIACFAVFA
jgi:predicted nuclease of restriction endonuclease-like (RecB) superfamily